MKINYTLKGVILQIANHCNIPLNKETLLVLDPLINFSVVHQSYHKHQEYLIRTYIK